MQRLERPIRKITAMNGPVAIGVFEDGTVLIAGPNDEPLLVRNGGVMSVVEHKEGGDYVFSYLEGAKRLTLDLTEEIDARSY